jgi:hypothetical protein
MNNNAKVVLGVVGALFAISFIVRFVVLSQAGLTGGWLLYLGLPIGGIATLLVLALRFGLLNIGETPHAVVPGPAPATAPTSHRLQELETLRSNGSISETEYAAKRARIISGI